MRAVRVHDVRRAVVVAPDDEVAGEQRTVRTSPTGEVVGVRGEVPGVREGGVVREPLERGQRCSGRTLAASRPSPAAASARRTCGRAPDIDVAKSVPSCGSTLVAPPRLSTLLWTGVQHSRRARRGPDAGPRLARGPHASPAPAPATGRTGRVTRAGTPSATTSSAAAPGSARSSTAAGPGITWPTEHGGRGGTPAQALVFDQEQAGFDVTSGFLAASIALVGPDAPRARLRRAAVSGTCRPLLRGDEVWCQLFSEPGAGSDLASLRHARRARRRRAGRQRPEGVDVGRAPRRPGDPARAHRPGRAQAPRHHVRAASTCTSPGHRRAAAAPDQRRRALQRGVPHRRARPGARTSSASSTAAGPPARTTLANESALIGLDASGGRRAPALIELARARGSGRDPVVREPARVGLDGASDPGLAARPRAGRSCSPGARRRSTARC